MNEQETVYIVYMVTTPEKVWSALTDSRFTRQYFFGRSIESDFKAGSTWKLLMEDGSVDTQGKVLESDPPRLLSLTWHVEWLEEYRRLPGAIVTYQIDQLGEIVRLTMRETHPQPVEEKYLEGGRSGWPVVLSGLKSLLETGRPLPKFELSIP